MGIEQISVGDWVLSQGESAGERVPKRVLRTFEFAPQPLHHLFGYDEEDSWYEFGTTNMLIRIRDETDGDQSWAELCQLSKKSPTEIELVSESRGWLFQHNDVFASGLHEGVGWIFDNGADKGGYVRYVKESESFPFSINKEDPHQDKYFCETVFNIEVEDFHSFFAGDVGMLVHDVTRAGKAYPTSQTALLITVMNQTAS